MKKEPTQLFTCHGGPFNKDKLRLSVNHPYTFTFNLKHWRGRYYSRNGADLLWEAA